MKQSQSASSWQELLSEILDDPSERIRIAKALSVHPVTLTRWVKQISRPHERNIRRLLDVLPISCRQSFRDLAAMEFPDLTLDEEPDQQVHEEVPSAFYAQMLKAASDLPLPLGQQTLRDLFFQQVIEQLDPDRHGMSISLATCVRPLEGHVVRSLRESGGIGTAPWKRDLEQKHLLLGAESLAGYALTHFRSMVVPNRTTPTFFPVRWTEHEQSAVAIPIARHAQVCGCLLASSAVPDLFREGRLQVYLLECYAKVASLLFEAQDFYELNDIQLSVMPPEEVQRPSFQHLPRRILQQLRLAQVRGEYCTLEQARHQVWREIEEELIETTLNHPPTT